MASCYICSDTANKACGQCLQPVCGVHLATTSLYAGMSQSGRANYRHGTFCTRCVRRNQTITAIKTWAAILLVAVVGGSFLLARYPDLLPSILRAIGVGV